MAAYDRNAPPDPSYLFRLPNKAQAGANVFAFQKTAIGSGVSGGGRWGFDVVFERREGGDGQGWTCA